MIRDALDSDETAVRLLVEAGTGILRQTYRPRPGLMPEPEPDLGPLVRLVLDSDGSLVGTVCYQRGRDRIHLSRLFVATSRLRQGLARQLVEHVARLALADGRSFLTLFTIRETGNIPVFQRLGFVVEHEEVDETVIGVRTPVLHSVSMCRRVFSPKTGACPHRLIMIEGLPGSGKTTTAAWLAQELRNRGARVDLVLENDPKNALPLPGSSQNLGDIIRAFAHGNALLPAWQRFASSRNGGSIAIVEARFWQDSLMFMRLGNRSVEDLAAAQAEVCEVIAPLTPVLIWLRQSGDMLREVNARKIASDPGWAEIARAAVMDQPWFQARREVTDMSAFYDDWSLQVEDLAQRLPIRLLRLEQPQADWQATYGLIREVCWPAGQ